MADWHERIVVDPNIMVGQPVVKGTRIPVQQVLELLSGGWTVEQVLDELPTLALEDIQAIHACAAELIQEYRWYPLSAA